LNELILGTPWIAIEHFQRGRPEQAFVGPFVDARDACSTDDLGTLVSIVIALGAALVSPDRLRGPSTRADDARSGSSVHCHGS
jgi:hypothetical protein